MHSNSPDISSRNAKERQHDGLGDISIWLDSYNDIFSDFDPRPYSQRTLSDDFLTQVRKVSHESEEKVNKLKLLLPADKREDKKEAVIAKRIHQHFKKHLHEHKKKYGATIRKGIFFTVGGMLLMLVASYISASQSQAFLKHMLLVMAEPSGWFMVWWGLEMIFYNSKPDKKEFNFYNKLSKSKIHFYTIR